MSVTSILSYNNKRYQYYRECLSEIRIPRINYRKYPIIAPAISSNYTLVGAAFDYFFRITIQREYPNYVKEANFRAETAIEMLCDSSLRTNVWDNNTVDIEKEILEKNIIGESVKQRYDYFMSVFYYSYINKYNNINEDLLKGCLFLAKLDAYTRCMLPHSKFDFFNEDDMDVKDLYVLANAFISKRLNPLNKILLNPNFGKSSNLVGGADADIIIDDMLIDIKVTKEIKITRQYFNQMLTYYLLNLNEIQESNSTRFISKIGFYFARYSCFIVIPIDALGNQTKFNFLLNILKENSTDY